MRKDARLTTHCKRTEGSQHGIEKWIVDNKCRNIRGNMWRTMKNITECARSVVMLDEKISQYADIVQGVAQGSKLSPNLCKVLTKDIIVAVQAAKKRVTVG